MDEIKVLFWDFDGVLMDSNAIRDIGFERVLADYPPEQVAQLLAFHRANGGLSRYVKFRYFFEEIRKEPADNANIIEWASKFSLIMKSLLVDPNLLIDETLNFVRKNQFKYTMFITSGSDQDELRFLCKSLGIDTLFNSIYGSPKPKKEWIFDIMKENQFKKENCVLIGDSINDWEAANYNGIKFCCYNNIDLSKKVSCLNFTDI
jgi:phosphoglycolate phosphatase-like HAD superfamily hydrolase